MLLHSPKKHATACLSLSIHPSTGADSLRLQIGHFSLSLRELQAFAMEDMGLEAPEPLDEAPLELLQGNGALLFLSAFVSLARTSTTASGSCSSMVTRYIDTCHISPPLCVSEKLSWFFSPFLCVWNTFLLLPFPLMKKWLCRTKLRGDASR